MSWYPTRRRLLTISIIILAILVIVILVSTVDIVELGYSAVIVDPLVGGIVNVVHGPRWYIKLPWQVSIKIYTATDVLDMWTEEATGQIGDYPAIKCLTKDGLEVAVDITIRWRIDPSKVADLYKNYPNLQWKAKTIASILRETVRNVISNFTATETFEKRALISQIISREFEIAIKKERTLANSIILEDVDLRNIELPKAFKTAVEEKLAAEQRKIAALYEREKRLIEANASAEARILEAQGEAQARYIEAEAIASQLRIISYSLGENETDLARIFLTLQLLNEIARNGGRIYVIVQGPGGLQIIPFMPLQSSREITAS